jgi:hypothetical protein
MKIIRLIPDLDTKFAYIENTGFSTKLLDAIIDGEEIEEVDFQKILVKNVTKEFPDLMGTGSSEFFVTERFKNLLEEKLSKQKIKFIEGVIHKRKYFLLNIIGLRDCMDYEESIFNTYKKVNLPHQITKLVVNENKVEHFDLFRLKDKPIHIFLTLAMKEIMQKEKFRGLDYIESMDLTFG